MADWPPSFDDFAADEEIDDEDRERLERRLDAAISFVQLARRDAFLVGDDGEPVQPVTLSARGERESDSLVLGAFMLASRLFARRRSPDVVLWMAETGTTRVPFDDRDIARMLRLHRPRVG